MLLFNLIKEANYESIFTTERARPVGFKWVINLYFAKHLPKLTRAVKYSIGDRTSLENMTWDKCIVGSLKASKVTSTGYDGEKLTDLPCAKGY